MKLRQSILHASTFTKSKWCFSGMFFEWKITTLSNTLIYILIISTEFHSLKTWKILFDFENSWFSSCKTNIKRQFFVRRDLVLWETEKTGFTKRTDETKKRYTEYERKTFSLLFLDLKSEKTSWIIIQNVRS